MKRLLPLVFLAVASTPAFAADPQQMQQQFDGLVGGVTRVMTSLTSQVIADQSQIESLQKQLADKDAEIAKLKAPEPPKTP